MFFRRKKVPANPFVRQDDPNTFRVRLRTRRYGDTVELRFTKSAHIGAADGGGFIFRKEFVSAEHFDRGTVTVRFDDRYQVTDVQVEGGEAVPHAEWAATH
ncbi:hypothetical protein [Deinococcus pimensis]|uniref:hypothetical protein n=1 Tax=Deinococcus pimensis TaxID=309888 RepID=UPI000481E80B|nr:hypothetical protein [Deinococcus pimensis]